MSNNQNNHNWSQTIGLLAGAAVVGGGIYALTKGLQSLFETEPEHQNSNADPHSDRDPDVEIITTVPACILAVRKLTKNCINYPVLGYDCKWVTHQDERQKIALLQLSDRTGYCALIRLCQLDYIPRELQTLLESRSILKLGVEPLANGHKLMYDYSLEGVCGALDLRHASLVAGQPNNNGLKQMARSELNVVMDETVVMSDWEAFHLSPQQVKCAAETAKVAMDLFHKFANIFGRSDDNIDGFIASLRQYVDMEYELY